MPAETVISSTHHYPDGTVTDVLRRASGRGWPAYPWCYRCTMRTPEDPTGSLDPAEAVWAREQDRTVIVTLRWRRP